ncbi:MAG: M56 family metallopeptidase [Crocinitomicaceae bacterium]
MIDVYTLIELSIWIILLYALYSVIRNFLRHSLRRWILLIIPLIAVGGFLLKQEVIAAEQSFQIPIIQLEAATVGNNEAVADTGFNLSWMQLYFIGFYIMAAFVVYKLIRLSFLFKGAERQNDLGIYLKTSPHKNSFSFFNRVHLTAGLDEVEREVVLEHEMHHVRKWHSLDLIVVEIYHALFWFNPIFFWVKRELLQVHEFEVDESMYKKHKASYLEVLLARTLDTASSQFLLTSQFYNKLTLAKRFKIMRTNRKHKNVLIMVIPAVAAVMTLVSWTTNNQNPGITDVSVSEIQNDTLYQEVDEMPEFKGGAEAMYEYIGSTVTYPEQAQKNGIEGTVYVQFVVEKNGNITQTKILRGVDQSIDAEALRIVQSMPAWKAGKKDGKAVKVKMTLPIAFKL